MIPFSQSLAWIVGFLWALSGVAIALGSGRSYLWRIAIFLGRFTSLLVPPDERPPWFATSLSETHDHRDDTPEPIDTVTLSDPEFDESVKFKPIAATSQHGTDAPISNLLFALGLLVVFAAIVVAALVDRPAPSPVDQAGIPVWQKAPSAATAPDSPEPVQSIVIADRGVDTPAQPIVARPPQMVFPPDARQESQRRYLGIDEEPVELRDGRRGVMVRKVYLGMPAERAGLRAGEVLWSVNGYMVQNYGDLAWLIANQTPGNTLQLAVYSPLFDMNRFVLVDLTQYRR